jgi:divalent metal cation (Fe/Co/Zn/Cd) transporter
MPAAELTDAARGVSAAVPGVIGIEKLFARKTGLQYHVDVHIEVDPAMTVLDSHEIASRVRATLQDQLPWVADVLVHVEPAIRH